MCYASKTVVSGRYRYMRLCLKGLLCMPELITMHLSFFCTPQEFNAIQLNNFYSLMENVFKYNSIVMYIELQLFYILEYWKMETPKIQFN